MIPSVGSVAQPAQLFSSSATTQIVTGLTPGTTYPFRVRGIFDDGTSSDLSVPSAAVTPARAPAPAIAAGGNHSCALLTSGTIQCWGQKTYGQLGNGTTLNANVPLTVTGY